MTNIMNIESRHGDTECINPTKADLVSHDFNLLIKRLLNEEINPNLSENIIPRNFDLNISGIDND